MKHLRMFKRSYIVPFSLLLLMTSCSGDGDEPSVTIYRIPVVVHVVHSGEEVGSDANISEVQVQSQIEVLNEDFRRKEGTNGFNNIGVDTQIEFYLAETDPTGSTLTEPGIDRVNGGLPVWPTGFATTVDSVLKPATF